MTLFNLFAQCPLVVDRGAFPNILGAPGGSHRMHQQHRPRCRPRNIQNYRRHTSFETANSLTCTTREQRVGYPATDRTKTSTEQPESHLGYCYFQCDWLLLFHMRDVCCGHVTPRLQGDARDLVSALRQRQQLLSPTCGLQRMPATATARVTRCILMGLSENCCRPIGCQCCAPPVFRNQDLQALQPTIWCTQPPPRSSLRQF